MRSRQKQCERCGRSQPVLYRVRHDAAAGWVFVCGDCWETVSQNNPFYCYGGTWKAKK